MSTIKTFCCINMCDTEQAIASALTCRLAGYLVPYYAVSEETAAPEGLCAGEALIAPLSALPRRSLRQWLSDLKDEQFLLPSFIFMLIAAVGFALMLWPWMFDTVQEGRSQLHRLSKVQRSKGYSYLRS